MKMPTPSDAETLWRRIAPKIVWITSTLPEEMLEPIARPSNSEWRHKPEIEVRSRFTPFSDMLMTTSSFPWSEHVSLSWWSPWLWSSPLPCERESVTIMVMNPKTMASPMFFASRWCSSVAADPEVPIGTGHSQPCNTASGITTMKAVPIMSPMPMRLMTLDVFFDIWTSSGSDVVNSVRANTPTE